MRPLRRPRKDKTSIYLKEISANKRKWIDSVQEREYWRSLVNAILKLGVP